jgi:hypothetical protein
MVSPQQQSPRRRSTTVLMPPLRTAAPSGRWPRKSHRWWTNAMSSVTMALIISPDM